MTTQQILTIVTDPRVLAVAGPVLLGLVLATTPRSDACSTHGYVRASTLNDLFNGMGGLNSNSGIEFSADNHAGAQDRVGRRLRRARRLSC